MEKPGDHAGKFHATGEACQPSRALSSPILRSPTEHARQRVGNFVSGRLEVALASEYPVWDFNVSAS